MLGAPDDHRPPHAQPAQVAGKRALTDPAPYAIIPLAL